MKSKCDRFVLDADVGRSAGVSEVPSSKGARDVMQAILKSDTVAIFCPTLSKEWSKHRSRFSMQWLSSMTARKKVIRVQPEQTVLAKILASNISDAEKEIAEKDVHLVDAAAGLSAVIASNDNAARAVFKQVLESSPLGEQVIWVSPTAASSEIVALINRSGFVPEDWSL